MLFYLYGVFCYVAKFYFHSVLLHNLILKWHYVLLLNYIAISGQCSFISDPTSFTSLHRVELAKK